MDHFDVIFVGGGPAGLYGAKVAADLGLSVLVLDKKQEIGTPVRCGEGLGNTWFKRLNIKPDPAWAVQGVYGATLWSPSGKKVEIRYDKISGYVLERKIFEKELARQAARSGAKVQAKTEVKELVKEGSYIKGVKAEFLDEPVEYSADIVVAADGFESSIARKAGLNTVNVLYHTDSGFQYEMAGIDLDDPEMIHLYFDENFAPRGYVWAFPKGDDYANVGVGIGADNPKTARQYLDAFISAHPEFAKGSIVEVNGGGIPVGGLLKDMVLDGFMAVGDAAHQVNPIHGGGMGLSMEAAKIAMEVAAEAIEHKNVSKEQLSAYNKRWWDTRGYEVQGLVAKRQMFEQLGNKDFEVLADAFSGEDLLELAYGSKVKIAATITKKLMAHPRLVKIMLQYLQAK